MFKRIAVANDGSDGGFKAFEMACELAKQHKATLHMISVEELPDFPASIDEVIEEKEMENHRLHNVVERARRLAKTRRVKFEVEVIAGHAVASIVERVRSLQADLLVVGFMGHSALYERIIGGTADRLVRLAPCPVLVVK
jgi:nucleotide-binding universal stress UspA family protein